MGRSAQGKVDIRGAVPVLAMPFGDDGAIDEDSLRRELDFCLQAGSQAICFGMGSESAALVDAERVQVWTLAARHLDGRVPLIAATSHISREGTIALTRLARECGVDCAMVDPQPRGGEQLVQLFVDLSDRVDLPLMIQDAGGNAPAPVLLQAAQQASCVVSLKLESTAAPLKIGAVAAGLREASLLATTDASDTAGSRRITILGGSNGNLLPEELERGSIGTMPHPAVIDAYRAVCDRFLSGDEDGARDLYIRVILPMQRVVAAADRGGGWAMLGLHKTLLQQAGVLRSTYCRLPIAALPEDVVGTVTRHVATCDLLVSHPWQAAP